MNNAQRDIRRKKRILEHAARIGNVRKTCHSCNTTRVTANFPAGLSCTSSNQSGPLRLRRKRDFLPLCRVVRRPLILSPSCS